MIVACENCMTRYDDEFRTTTCPHDTFLANDGNNNFRHYPESFIDPVKRIAWDKYGKIAADILNEEDKK